jgi:hypothetical protein
MEYNLHLLGYGFEADMNILKSLVVLIVLLTVSCRLPPSKMEQPEGGIGVALVPSPTLGIEKEVFPPTSTPSPMPMGDVVTPVNQPQPEPTESVESESSPSMPISYLYGTQPGSPVRISSWMHDCNWMGVAGQVFDGEGKPINNLIVEAGGILDGESLLGLSITGIEHGYGSGGYEIELGQQPSTSENSIWVQLKDIDGQPLSRQIYIDTASICDENLVLLNFIEGGIGSTEYIYYFPIFSK